MAVVEGYTDVIAAHQVGLANVVGTLGTAFGERSPCGACKRLADRVVLVFDGDEAGQIGRGPVAGAVPGARSRRARPDSAGEPGPLRLPA